MDVKAPAQQTIHTPRTYNLSISVCLGQETNYFLLFSRISSNINWSIYHWSTRSSCDLSCMHVPCLDAGNASAVMSIVCEA